MSLAAMSDEVEDFLAEIQVALAGLQPWDDATLTARCARLDDALDATGTRELVGGLLASDALPSIADAFCEIDGEPPARHRTYLQWCQTGRERLGELWSWARRHMDDGRWDSWWWPTNPSPAPQTLDRLRGASGQLVDLGSIVDGWAEIAGLSSPVAEHDWRWLGLGRGLPMTLPPLVDVVRSLAMGFRRYGLLPTEHAVKFVRQRNKPSHVAPIRLPGESVFFVSDGSPPLCVQFIQHELAHLAEHACRPASAPLAERWALDPVRSEGWALLCELIVRDPTVLRQLGLSTDDAETLAEFLRHEERFNRGLMAADLALYERVGGVNTLEAAIEQARALAAECNLRWAPEVMLFRLPHIGLWRTYLAAWRWRDDVADRLCTRFGPSWHQDASAWARMSGALASTGSADAWIQRFEGYKP